MKIFMRLILIIFLIILLAYVTNITSIPDSIILFKGEELELGAIFGIYIEQENKTVETASNINGNNILEKKKVSLKLFNLIDVKDVEVNTIPKTKVIPLGNSARIKALYKWSFSCGKNRGTRRKTL